MFKWFKDARYADVQAELKVLRAELKILAQSHEALHHQLNSVRGAVNRSKAKNQDEEGEESLYLLSDAEKDFLRSLPDYEKEALPEKIKKAIGLA